MEKDPLVRFIKSAVSRVKLRRRYSPSMPKDYKESYQDWADNNSELVTEFLELLEETKRARRSKTKNKGV